MRGVIDMLPIERGYTTWHHAYITHYMPTFYPSMVYLLRIRVACDGVAIVVLHYVGRVLG